MTVAIETATEPQRNEAVSVRPHSLESGFGAALLGSVGKSISSATAQESAGVGRGSASAASGKRKDDEKEIVKRARAMADPAAIAAGQLATHGTPKATVEAAETQQVTASPKSEQPRVRSTSGGSQPSAPNQSDREAKAADGNDARTRSGGRSAVSDRASKTGPGEADAKQSPSRAEVRPGAKSSTPISQPKPMDAAQALARLAQAINRGADRPAATSTGNRPVLRVETAPAALRSAPTRSAKTPPPAQQAKQTEDDFAAQLGRGFSAVLRQNGGTLTLRMQPQELGDLTIRMDLKPGQVAAEFEVGSDQARQLLTDQMTSLRSALEARGLSVDKLTVHLSEQPTPEALANRAELGTNGGTLDGGASGRRGNRPGVEHPRIAGIAARSAQSDNIVSVPGKGPEVEMGGALTVRLVLDAVA